MLSISLKSNFKGWAKKKNIVFMEEVMVVRQGVGQNPHQGLVQVVELTEVGEAPCCTWPVLRCVSWTPSRDTRHMPHWRLSFESHLGIANFMLCVLFFSAPRRHGPEVDQRV